MPQLLIDKRGRKPQYLRIRNWERFQHYKDRRPVWIKLHVELLDDYELTHLDYVTQLVYDRLLLLAARTDNNIPNDPQHIGRQISVEPKKVAASLENLLVAGFLVTNERKRSASKAIARRKQNAMPETEAETEKDKYLETERTGDDDMEIPVLPLFAPSGALQTLGADRELSYRRLLERVTGGDRGTPRVLERLCKQLPADRIDEVAASFKRCVPPGVAVNALKIAVNSYEAEVSARV